MIDTEVQIFDKEGGQGKCYKIKEVYEDYFIIDEDIDTDDCFVFGYCIDDLHGLHKSYFFTLNVCDTQELHRRIEVQKVVIQSQDERIKQLETKVERLLNYLMDEPKKSTYHREKYKQIKRKYWSIGRSDIEN